MRNLFLRIVLLLVIQIGTIETASAEYLIPVDTCLCQCDLIHYTDAQDIRCLICLQNQVDKDSLIVLYTRRILTLDTEIADHGAEITRLEQRGRTKFRIGLIIGSVGGLILGVLVGSVIK